MIRALLRAARPLADSVEMGTFGNVVAVRRAVQLSGGGGTELQDGMELLNSLSRTESLSGRIPTPGSRL